MISCQPTKVCNSAVLTALQPTQTMPTRLSTRYSCDKEHPQAKPKEIEFSQTPQQQLLHPRLSSLTSLSVSTIKLFRSHRSTQLLVNSRSRLCMKSLLRHKILSSIPLRASQEHLGRCPTAQTNRASRLKILNAHPRDPTQIQLKSMVMVRIPEP